MSGSATSCSRVELFSSLTDTRVALSQLRNACEHGRSHGGLNWMTPAAFVARLDDTATGAVPAASLGVSPVGATPSLRHTKRMCPRPSHEHWYRNQGGVSHPHFVHGLPGSRQTKNLLVDFDVDIGADIRGGADFPPRSRVHPQKTRMAPEAMRKRHDQDFVSRPSVIIPS